MATESEKAVCSRFITKSGSVNFSKERMTRKGWQFTWLWISQNSAQENGTEVEEAKQSGRLLGIVKSYTCQWLQKVLEGTFELGLNSSSEHKLIPQPCIKHQSAINQKINKSQVNFPNAAFPPYPPFSLGGKWSDKIILNCGSLTKPVWKLFPKLKHSNSNNSTDNLSTFRSLNPTKLCKVTSQSSGHHHYLLLSGSCSQFLLLTRGIANLQVINKSIMVPSHVPVIWAGCCVN